MTVPGSDVKYFKAQYDVKHYIPLTKKHEFTLLMRGRLGYGNGYGQTDGNDNLFPFYENYYAGGLQRYVVLVRTPRALKRYENSVGNNPTYDTATDDSVGGNAVALASLELIVPTPLLLTKRAARFVPVSS